MIRNLTTVVALSLALTSCKSTGVDQAEDAAQNMRALKTALEDAPAQIDAVSTTLAALTKGDGDMQKQFATFSTNVDSLIDHRNEIRSLRAEVRASQGTFTKAWEERLQAIQSDDLRKRAEQRRDAVVAKFAEITAIAESGKAEFEPWLQKVLDVRTYLESDLNPSGVASVQDQAEEISSGAAAVNQKITAVVAGLNEMGDAIAAGKPPAESKEGSTDGSKDESKK
jgi:chromosome segregation ATPase